MPESATLLINIQQIKDNQETTIKLLGLLHETLQTLLETTKEGVRIQVNGEKLTKAVLEDFNHDGSRGV